MVSDSELVFMLNLFTLLMSSTSRAKTVVILGCTEELMNTMHAGRKIIGQTNRIRLPFSLWQIISLPMPNLSVTT